METTDPFSRFGAFPQTPLVNITMKDKESPITVGSLERPINDDCSPEHKLETGLPFRLPSKKLSLELFD